MIVQVLWRGIGEILRISPRQVEAFRSVMLTNSMTAAADLLNISQPAVTRLIKDLEESVGIALFHRVGTRLAPTREALLLLPAVERLFVGLEDIEEAARSIRRNPLGTLRIAAMPLLSLGYLAKTTRAFLKPRPQLSISVHFDTSVNIVDLVARSQYDLGICSVPAIHPRISFEQLAPVEAVCILPRNHPLSAESEIHASDLDGIDFVSLGHSSLLRQQVNAVLAAEGVTVNLKVETLYSATVRAFVEHGLGVSIVDPFVAADTSHQGIAVRPFRPRIPYEFALVFPPNVPPSQLAQEFGATFRRFMADDFGEL